MTDADLKRKQNALIPEDAGRIWFYKPSLWWHGWRTLLPLAFGGMCGDEYGRRTLVIGWTITGRIIIAVRTCYCGECCNSREETHYWRKVGLEEGWWEE